jgi:AcrR family transcriptional regulator
MARKQRRLEQPPKPAGLRASKKLALRLALSNAATRLFVERGFDNVTIDQVAAAANVSKMTVFNYFARKEDLFFDRDDEPRKLIQAALEARGAQSPLRALHALALRLIDQKYGLGSMGPRVTQFWRTVSKSPALRARARELNQEIEHDLTRSLAQSVGKSEGDPVAKLVAALALSAWRVAFREALRGANGGQARKTLRMLLDRGFKAAEAAASASPYV